MVAVRVLSADTAATVRGVDATASNGSGGVGMTLM
jgi:hypothetical protein